MIKKISIHRYKSFHPTTPTVIDIDTSKKATLIYGLNGAGKSAIGEVIHGRSVNDQTFAHCQVETTGTGPFRHLVYNHAFVGRVIGETMPGIFTIGEMDTAKQQEIDETEASTVGLEADLAKQVELVDKIKQLVDAQNTRGIEDVWKAHGLGKKTTLAELLTGYGRDKRKFFDDLRKSATPPGTPLDTLERLEQRWNDVSGNETSKKVPHIDFSGITDIETDPIWTEAIELSSTSRLAALIAALGNGDWIDVGQGYVKDNTCPFCQQKLPHDFQEELAKLLEGERKLKIDKIQGLVSNYTLRMDRIYESVREVLGDPLTKDPDIEIAWAKLEGKMKANIALMRTKKDKPGDQIVIEKSDHQAMIAAITDARSKVEDFNKRILDRAGERTKIKTMFYQALCADRVDAYASHDAAIAPLIARLDVEKASAQKIADQIRANSERLSRLRQSQTGVDASVETINGHLKELGIDSFWIKRKEGGGHLYCLARPNNTTSTTRSLSEGEKTLISFLYFMELIKGTHQENGVADVTKTIVVIDDPISSLSQNFIYDVATIIQHQLIKPPDGVPKVRQVIVMTHNLFFFHELVLQLAGRTLSKAHGRCQMLRVYKGEYSAVTVLDPTAHMNDYDALWQVLRDAKENPAMLQVVPNTMRCILEQFFTFTAGNAELEKAMEKLSIQDPSHKFKALHRYLDRGSHKDGINVSPMDWSQYDLPYYLKKFQELFREAGQEQHYLRRMADPVEEAG